MSALFFVRSAYGFSVPADSLMLVYKLRTNRALHARIHEHISYSSFRLYVFLIVYFDVVDRMDFVLGRMW